LASVGRPCFTRENGELAARPAQRENVHASTYHFDAHHCDSGGHRLRIERPGDGGAKPITVWHVFNLDTDMIYGGIKSFNETQTAYRIDARLVPAINLSPS